MIELHSPYTDRDYTPWFANSWLDQAVVQFFVVMQWRRRSGEHWMDATVVAVASQAEVNDPHMEVQRCGKPRQIRSPESRMPDQLNLVCKQLLNKSFVRLEQ